MRIIGPIDGGVVFRVCSGSVVAHFGLTLLDPLLSSGCLSRSSRPHIGGPLPRGRSESAEKLSRGNFYTQDFFAFPHNARSAQSLRGSRERIACVARWARIGFPVP